MEQQKTSKGFLSLIFIILLTIMGVILIVPIILVSYVIYSFFSLIFSYFKKNQKKTIQKPKKINYFKYNINDFECTL